MSLVTPACLRALRALRDAEVREEYENAEIVCDGIECYIDLTRISYRTVQAMLRLCLIHDDSDTKGCCRYSLNEDGRAMADNPEHVPRIVQLMPHLYGSSKP